MAPSRPPDHVLRGTPEGVPEPGELLGGAVRDGRRTREAEEEGSTAPAVRSCPLCGTALNRLSGPDGHAVEPVAPAHGGKVFERKKLSTVIACPKCEYIEELAYA